MADEPLHVDELAILLVRLEQAVAETSGRFTFQMTMVAALFAVLGIFFALSDSMGVAVGAWIFAAGIGYLGYAAGKKTAPEKMRPIVDAVKDTPDKITLVRHYETSDSMRMFVNHWLEIKTAEHRLVIKAPDWTQLFGFLERRCPNAEFKR